GATRQLVLGGGLEPPCLAAYAPQTYVSAISPPERTFANLVRNAGKQESEKQRKEWQPLPARIKSSAFLRLATRSDIRRLGAGIERTGNRFGGVGLICARRRSALASHQANA